jgi:hypothetical protein
VYSIKSKLAVIKLVILLMALRNGVVDQKYAFEYDVGQWTFGKISVYRLLQDNTTLRTVKTVPKNLVRSSPNVINQLKQLQELRHNHICSIKDVLEDQANYYIISEFMQGGEVSDWVERLQEGYAIQEQTCAAYVRQAILAMMHSHSAQVFHGSLLPSSLSLSSKMPDAHIKVSDFGLGPILDPENHVVRRKRSPYTAPEVLSGQERVDGSSDMYSIGAIAHALLVGRAPGNNQNQSWWRGSRNDEQFWSERSPVSRDFVTQLLQDWEDRPTPARALQHPWLKGNAQSISGVLTDTTAEKDMQSKTLCYMLAVLMLPISLPYRDFEQLRSSFQDNDSDTDGLVPRHIVQRILRSRCAVKEAVDAAILITDVSDCQVYDLCSTACADIIARDFFSGGSAGQPCRASALASQMLNRLFETLAKGQSTIDVSLLRSRLRTATARDIEIYAEVKYEHIFALLPREPIDSQTLASYLSSSRGHGTPLGSGFGHGRQDSLDSVSPLESFGFFDFFGQCGMGMKRDRSPFSVQTA